MAVQHLPIAFNWQPIANDLASALSAVVNDGGGPAAMVRAYHALAKFAAAEHPNPADVFAVYVESRRDSATDERTREYWHRLLGNVRKAATL